MTEAWKSNPHYFCEVCKVWMNDNPQARATHERGIKHTENMARKLRDMRNNAEKAKRDEAAAAASMSDIEAKARQQYDKDVQEGEEAKRNLTGSWEKDEGSGHFYNAIHRHYYDSSTGMYYGGDPPAWTVTPSIPSEALYKAPQAKKEPQPSTSGASPASNPTKLRAGLKYKGSHPQANIGGYRMPTEGRIGGAKGVGMGASGASTAGVKRAREAPAASKAAGKEMSAAEKEAQEKREAARARVQQRTMQQFGLT